MSGVVTSGLEKVRPDEKIEKHDRSAELGPERHDSKVSSDQEAAAAAADRSEDGSTLNVEGGPDAVNRERDGGQRSPPPPLYLNSDVVHHQLPYRSANQSSPSPVLHLVTNVQSPSPASTTRVKETPTIFETPVSEESSFHHALSSSSALPIMGSSLRSNLSTSSMASSISQGSASALTSPYLAALSDLTPLPSPMATSESSGPSSWRRSLGRPATSRSRGGSMEESSSSTVDFMQPTSPPSSKKRKGYGSLLQDAVETSMANAAAAEGNAKVGSSETHARTRSVSDFKPEQLHNLRHRHVTLGPGDHPNVEVMEYHMHREAYLAAKRGLSVPPDPRQQQQQQFPTPPPSTSSTGENDSADEERPHLEDGSSAEYLEIHCGMHNKRRKFRELRQLGQGTFSKVMLATRERIPANITPEIEEHLDPHKLVAVKIVEQGPAGGADEHRIEIGLKREVEMLKSLSHPSLIHLRACEYQESRALLVLTYCPGGDLFELASEKRELLTPNLVQRIFSELVPAVQYLHANWIVHRDIKLENVLVNLPRAALANLSSPLTHPVPIVTLTDLGLSRRIPQPPESPLLTTRCGSEDYAAPEILLGQQYDGRQTDAWALGVLLYALMEGRLPFDAPPGQPERSRNTHRIARCDWIWCRFGDEEGDWDESRGAEWEGARVVVEALLKKIRMGRKALGDVAGMEWVSGGVGVEGGLRVRDWEDEDAWL